MASDVYPYREVSKTFKRRPSLTEAEKTRIVELYTLQWSDRQIAKELGTVHYMIARYRNSVGLPSLRPRGVKINMVDRDTAKCSRCGRIAPITDFSIGRKGKPDEYLFSYCNLCKKARAYAMASRTIESHLRHLTTRLRAKCKARGIYCGIEDNTLLSLWNEQQGKCFYTGTPMIAKLGIGYDRYRASVDKVVPAKGYIADNIVLCCQKANAVKTDLSLTEMRDWIPAWYEKIVGRFPHLKE